MLQKLTQELKDYSYPIERVNYQFNGIPVVVLKTYKEKGKPLNTAYIKVLINTNQYKVTFRNEEGFTLLSPKVSDVIGILEYKL